MTRHPTYLGELVMLDRCSVSGGSLLAWTLAAIAILLVALRILAEERLLFEDVG